MVRRPYVAAAVLSLLAVASASAQRCGWSVVATPTVSPASPVAVIQVYAWFDFMPKYEIYHSGRVHLFASDPAFQSFELGWALTGSEPRWHPVFPTAINDIVVGQVHLPPQILANPENPIHVITARWQVEEFTPRLVTITAEPVAGQRMSTFINMNTRGGYYYPAVPVGDRCYIRVEGICYADCDTSTSPGALDIFDFLCFQNRYESGHSYACDCDTGTSVGVCDIFDFICFQNAFAGGCP